MAQSNFQFNTTKSEMIDFLIPLIQKYNFYCVVCYKKLPDFIYKIFDTNDINKNIFYNSKEVFLFLNKPFDEKKYYDFIEQNQDFFEIELGKETSEYLEESSMGFFKINEDKIIKLFRKIIREYKKTMLKGGLCYNRITKKTYPEDNIYYTPGVKKLFEQGVEIRTIAPAVTLLL